MPKRCGSGPGRMLFDVCSWKRAVGLGEDYMVVNAGNCSTCVPGMGPRQMPDTEWFLPRTSTAQRTTCTLYQFCHLILRTFELPLIPPLAPAVHPKETKGALVKKNYINVFKGGFAWFSEISHEINHVIVSVVSINHTIFESLRLEKISSSPTINPSCIDKYQQFLGRCSDLRINTKKQ